MSEQQQEERHPITVSANHEITPGRKNTRHKGYIVDYRPQARTVTLLNNAIRVLDEYRDYWPLTVRQIFYRLVGKYDYPKDETAYKRLCHHIAEARRAKKIPFRAIRDDGISWMPFRHFEDTDEFLRHLQHLASSYTRDRMVGQRHYIEVWCEAAGMVPQLAEVATAYSVPVYSSSGFDSLTAKHMLADRICKQGKPAIIIHLGDLDPSGQSIFASVAEDVAAFIRADKLYNTVTVEFRRLALTAAQVRHYGLPTAPPKSTDSRTKAWDGQTCQLEALPPNIITGLLRTEIAALMDEELLEYDTEMEQAEREILTRRLLTAGSDN